MRSAKERKLNLENLNHGLQLKLASAGADETANHYLLAAATWFEKSAQEDPTRAAEYRYLAALGYYVSGHYAQAYVLFRNTHVVPEPYTAHGLLRRLFARELAALAADGCELLARAEYTDEGITADVTSGHVAQVDAVERALLAAMHAAFLDVCAYVQSGDSVKIDRALGQIDTCYRLANNLSSPQTAAYPSLLQGATAMLRELRDNSIWARLAEMCTTDRTGLVQRYIESAVKRSPPLVELWPSQVVTIRKISEGDATWRPNFLVKMPTSAGKTNIAEIAILQFLADSAGQPGKKCIYIAPFHALGAQIEARLRASFLPLGVGLSDLYGGFEISPADPFLFNQQRILVATPEKMDALLRYDPDFASQVGLVFIDEGHLIEDGERGMRFEMLVHRLVRRFANGGARLILASAVLGQADNLVQWITGTTNADGLQTSNFRPTRNYLGLLSWDGQTATREFTHVSDENSGGYKSYQAPKDVRVRALPDVTLGQQDNPQMSLFPDGESIHAFSNEKKNKASGFPRKGANYEAVALAALREARDGMTLVYSPTKPGVERIGNAILDALDHASLCRQKQLTVDVFELQTPADQSLIERCINLADEMAGADSLITRALRRRFVVHYDGVPQQLRNALAPLIERGMFRLVVATSTIVHGVNTPAKTVIMYSLIRGDKKDKTKKIPAREFLNVIGRAGRAMQETEGIALLFTKAKQSDRARDEIRDLISRVNVDELKSALRTFLCKVIDEWQDRHPGAGVAELCEALANERMDWLSPDVRQQLDELDRELLALLQELRETDTEPITVEELFGRSLVALQAAGETDPWHGRQTSLSLLTARVEALRKIPPAVRRAYYRTGLPLTDCRALERSAEALLALVGTFGQIPEYSAEQVAGILWGLYQDFLKDLSIFRPLKHSPPTCAEQILRAWLEGLRVDAMADLPAVKETGLARADVTAFVDDFCGVYLPWALNAVRGYVGSISPNMIAEGWLSSWSAMVHFGLPSPKAAIFYALGLRSREAAIRCAEHCPEPAESPRLMRWLANLANDEIQRWQVSDHVRQEVTAFRDSLKSMAETWPGIQKQ